ncbi:MAG TPA: RDD family protein [Alphaproteobacteria bacterium]|nr:RDD family protein [Alphaproteobacteria bacterium]
MAFHPGPHESPEVWQSAAPDPLDHPEYYEGVVLRRIAAHLLDFFLIILLVLIFNIFFFALHVISLGLLSLPLLLVSVVIPLAYDSLQVAGRRSATLGMRAFGIEVRSWTGARPPFAQALLRAALFWGMSYLTAALLMWLLLGFALFNRRRRCLHDYLSGTVVIRAAKVMVLGPDRDRRR